MKPSAFGKLPSALYSPLQRLQAGLRKQTHMVSLAEKDVIYHEIVIQISKLHDVQGKDELYIQYTRQGKFVRIPIRQQTWEFWKNLAKENQAGVIKRTDGNVY